MKLPPRLQFIQINCDFMPLGFRFTEDDLLELKAYHALAIDEKIREQEALNKGANK